MRTAARLLSGAACLLAAASAFASPRANSFVIDAMRGSQAPVSQAPVSRSLLIDDSDAGTDPDATTPDAEGGTDASALPGRIPYNGGPIISQVRVAAVLWGSTVDSTVVRSIGGFYAALTQGALMHFASEYSTPTQQLGSYGSFLGTFRIHPTHTNDPVTDDDVQAELAQQIAFGALPASDANTVYMIHFPPGVNVQGPGSTGLSCVDYCGYHYYGNGLTYAILPDQSGGCAPGPFGCESSTTARCCGDRSAFDNLTKSASHELIEAITDPQPLAPAWTDILGGFGEVADICNFSKLGDNAYTNVISQSGRTYQAQRAFSNSAYFAGVGSPRGCVAYPTTLCCDAPAPSGPSMPPPAPCSWLPNGLASCAVPAGDMSLSMPTIGGFGAGTMTLVNTSPYSGVCFPLGAGLQKPDYCATVQAPGLVEQPNTTVMMPLDPNHPNAEDCFGPPPATGCPNGTSETFGSCCGKLIPFVASGTTQSLQTSIPGVATVPALPSRKAALCAILLLGLGCLRSRKARSSPHAMDSV